VDTLVKESLNKWKGGKLADSAARGRRNQFLHDDDGVAVLPAHRRLVDSAVVV
jgi:hypothetical protein